MQDESQAEKIVSPELSPTEIISQMSQRVDEIITDSETTKVSPSPYFGIKKNTSEAGIETTSLSSSRSGAGLNRTSDPNTGATLYELSVLYHGTGDRGADIYSWSTLEPVVNYSVNSEMNGQSEVVPKTDPNEIKSTQLFIEQYFPEQPPKVDNVKQSFARRVLARLRK
jgi:hypothetical protein